MERRALSVARWWLAIPVCALLLVLFDVPLHFWRPQPQRLPENFSPGYLQRVCENLLRGQRPIIVLGDSVLWGYKLPASEAPIATLLACFPASASSTSATKAEVSSMTMFFCGTCSHTV